MALNCFLSEVPDEILEIIHDFSGLNGDIGVGICPDIPGRVADLRPCFEKLVTIWITSTPGTRRPQGGAHPSCSSLEMSLNVLGKRRFSPVFGQFLVAKQAFLKAISNFGMLQKTPKRLETVQNHSQNVPGVSLNVFGKRRFSPVFGQFLVAKQAFLKAISNFGMLQKAPKRLKTVQNHS
jgi:hypothetical protein